MSGGILFLTGAMIGILFGGVLATLIATRETEKEMAQTYKNGYEAGKEEGKRIWGRTVAPHMITTNKPLYSIRVEEVVDGIDLEIGGDLFMNHVKDILAEGLGKEAMEYATIRSMYWPSTGKTHVTASVYVARRE